MAQNCLQIVNWLKSWFYDKTETDSLLASKQDVEEWVQVHTSTDGKLKAYKKGDNVRLISSGYTLNATTTWTRIGSTAFLSAVKPHMPVVTINGDYTILFRVDDSGNLHYRSVSGTISNKNNYFQMDWTI